MDERSLSSDRSGSESPTAHPTKLEGTHSLNEVIEGYFTIYKLHKNYG